MKTLIAIGLAAFMSAATTQTGLPAPCDDDFGVHPYDAGQPAPQALVDESHVSQTSRRVGDDSRLMIALDETGAERMLEFTRKNIGEQMVVICDGQEVWKARIADEFGERFEISL